MGFLTLGLGAGGAGPHAVAAAGLVNALENERSCSISRRAGRAELLLDGGEAEAAVGDGEAGDGGWRGTGGTWRDRAPREGGEGADQGPGMPDPVKNNGGRQRPRTTTRCSTPPVLINRERAEMQRGGKWRNERARRGLAWVAEGVGRRRQGAGLRVNGGDETDEVAVGVTEVVRDQRSSGARAREAGKGSGWSRYLATRTPGLGSCL